MLASVDENLLPGKGPKPDPGGARREPALSAALPELPPGRFCAREAEVGSWPAPRGPDRRQQVCTKCGVCAEARARTVKGTRQQEAVLDLPEELPDARWCG